MLHSLDENEDGTRTLYFVTAMSPFEVQIAAERLGSDNPTYTASVLLAGVALWERTIGHEAFVGSGNNPNPYDYFAGNAMRGFAMALREALGGEDS